MKPYRIFVMMGIFLSGVFAGNPVLSDPPVADFFATPKTGWDRYYQPEFVSVSTGMITGYHWDFGDGNTSTHPAPSHQYASPGTYSIQLIVSGPTGSDTLTKENYITVKDFNDYPYPTYIIKEPAMEIWDAILDSVQASQLPGPDPGEAVWWDQTNSNSIRHGGGGRVLFAFSDDTLYIDHERNFFGDNLIIDGEDKNVHFYYNGPDACSQTEGQDALLRIHGNDNIVRNIHFDRFPEGVHMRGGHRNLLENIVVNVVCEDAMTMNGGGYYAHECIIRNCEYQQSEDKTIMINNGFGTLVVDGIYSNNGNQPIRMTGGGLLVVRNCTFTGDANNGPRFGGKDNLVIFENNYSYGTKSGVRLTDNVHAIVRHNVMENCTQYGIRIYNDGTDCRLRLENNDVLGNPVGIYVEKNAVVDLGGGLVDVHTAKLHSGPGTIPRSSAGENTMVGSLTFDLNNKTGQLIMAENNVWDHKTAEEVLSEDVSGAADVDPLHPLSSAEYRKTADQAVTDILMKSFPNPFNDSVTIQIELPAKGRVTVNIYDSIGRHVTLLADQVMNGGLHRISWTGRDQSGHPVASGVYLVRLAYESHDYEKSKMHLENRIVYMK